MPGAKTTDSDGDDRDETDCHDAHCRLCRVLIEVAWARVSRLSACVVGVWDGGGGHHRQDF